MEVRKSYEQLRAEERFVIAREALQGASVRSIARHISRSPSTVSRELARNCVAGSMYWSDKAQASAELRRRSARQPTKLDPRGVLWPTVVTLLHWRWSPEQIATTLRRTFPLERQRHVSHETIYTAIYALPRGELRRQLISLLRQSRASRRPRSGGTDRRERIPDMVSIHVRPPEVGDRLMPGHWEGDLIKGAGNRSAVGVLVERTSRMVLLARMPDATAESALAGFTLKLRSIAKPLRKTLTYDRGSEMVRHRELAAATGVRVYFCDPYSPWQRAGCENTNGLLRQYLPKGTDLSVYSQDELDAIADSLNTRPRRTLDWSTPLQVYSRMLAAPPQPSQPLH
jgi:IS30 family transposase